MNHQTKIINMDDAAEAQIITEMPSMMSAEIDLQISTAKKYPRSIAKFRTNTLAYVTLDERVAAQCIYSLPPRDGKTIEGPSARMAEVLVMTFGNCRSASRIVNEGEHFITAQGVFLDLEANASITVEVQRRIVGANGRRFGVDMIGMTGNAASSIALRNAVLKGIPKALWWDAYGAAMMTVKGDIKTLGDRRKAALDAFAPFGITPAQIVAALGVGGVADIGPDQLVSLSGWLTAIKDEGVDPETMFMSVQNLRTKSATSAPTAKAPTQSAVSSKDAPTDASAKGAEEKEKPDAQIDQAQSSKTPSDEDKQSAPAADAEPEQSGEGKSQDSGPLPSSAANNSQAKAAPIDDESDLPPGLRTNAATKSVARPAALDAAPEGVSPPTPPSGRGAPKAAAKEPSKTTALEREINNELLDVPHADGVDSTAEMFEDSISQLEETNPEAAARCRRLFADKKRSFEEAVS